MAERPEMAEVVAGVRLGVASASIHYVGRPDLMLMEIAPSTQCAAVFTRNAFCAAPVVVAREHLAKTMPRYLVVNAGNANAGTGDAGLDDARATCAAVAELMGCRFEEVLPFSTGVIGEPLPLARLVKGLPQAFADLRPDGWDAAARAIMTTDTRPKCVSRRLSVGGQTVSVVGTAKGAGMIRPDMATMLAFIATDAEVDREVLRRCLRQSVAASFNAITVDGDTSTNDACVLLATGLSGVRVREGNVAYDIFSASLSEVCTELAQAIVRDGEGATKLITIEVEQGRDEAECRRVAYTVATSPLVKTAFFASDPNWGRILAAVGRAGLEHMNVGEVAIHLGDVCIVRNGARDTDYTEARGQRVMASPEITVRIELGRGRAKARIWTTDLSHDYVRINAEYRT
jgi:glutamate N-acetyltransferase/amino-acid N-acetyltransferase